jgi:hypothetical protein
MPARTIAAAATTARTAATTTVNVAVTVAGKDNLMGGDSRRLRLQRPVRRRSPRRQPLPRTPIRKLSV